MDLDEWEYLPDDAFLDFHEESEKKVFFSKRYFDSKSVFNMYHDYCIIQSPNCSSSKKLVATDQVAPAVPPNQLSVPVQIQLLPPPSFFRSTQSPDEEKQEALVPVSAAAVVTGTTGAGGGGGGGEGEGDQDPLLSQVYFKKTTWEPEFVDMKMDSPKSPTSRGGLGSGFVHQTSSDSTAAAGGAKFQFDDYNGEPKVSSPRMKTNKEEDEQGQRQNNNIWKLSFSGIGAICSFGFAAATICILFLGSHQRNNQNHKHFQIYTDDNKRIKEVVQRATKLNEAFSAVRGGVPLTRAHITSGGYYTGAL
ncbi:uncharacterized protein LOC133722174 [Rosa rugosa]|uniref:uncharacterized protein LOC133722174 n=1 Tax=Rosa rugosa TaxID=74645 RepID=UPI002B414A8A|nr:uncharacterized protein LOC133722174 [Rosa rugosa]